VPSKKRRHSSTYSNNILPTITKNNNILELQHFLKHNDFVGKSANKFTISMLENLTKKINKKHKRQWKKFTID
jgi:hypothetical protein